LALDVCHCDVESASSLLFDLGALGVEERDGTTLVHGAPGKVTLVASFEHEDNAREAMSEVPAEWSPRVAEVVGDEWRDEWKKHFEPFHLGGAIVVCPPWRTYNASEGEQVLVLEPGRAFGTGLHETTCLSAEVLTEHSAQYGAATVLDVGCGSGILGLVALIRGAARVRAIDVDPEAVAVTRENAHRNGMTQRLEVDDAPIDALVERYPVVVANIEASPLVAIAPAVMARLAPGGLAILSGILVPEVAPQQLESVRKAYGDLHEQEVRRKGEWLAVAFRG